MKTQTYYLGQRNIVLTLGYYGNKQYGKRVHWITIDGEQTFSFVWNDDLNQYVKELMEEGHNVTIKK